MHTSAVAGKEKVDLQIRGVPAKLQRRIRANAARKGVSMSKYVIEILDDNVDRPGTLGDWLDEIAKDQPKTDLRPGEATAMMCKGASGRETTPGASSMPPPMAASNPSAMRSTCLLSNCQSGRTPG